MKKTLLLLFVIIVLGLFLRFYKLGEIPVGFHRDEAFLGYNAYSILKTGKDINGNFLPLHLESFLYSPAGYSYFSAFFIGIFGLNEFSVRFASAFFGTLSIFVLFLLVQNIFRQFKYKDSLSLVTAFLFSISPWHINLSRTATENTVSVFFILFGALMYLFWVEQRKIYLLILSFCSFGLTLLIYQAPRAFLPLFIPLLIVTFLNKKIQKKELLITIGAFLIIVIIPLFTILSSKNLSLRIRTLSFFSSGETQLLVNEQIKEDGISKINVFIARSFHNKILGYADQFLQNYMSHLSYSFLLSDKVFPERYKVPSVGLLYLYELPFILSGLWFLFKKNKNIFIFLVGWIIIGPIGSALTFDDIPNLQRTLVILPPISIISSFGIVSLFIFIREKLRFFKTSIFIFGLLIFYCFIFYFHQYYIHQKFYKPWYRQVGYKELVYKVNKELSFYKKAVITDRESAPTIFFLFYGKYDPALFQQETKYPSIHDFDRIGFGKYEFSQEECPLNTSINISLEKKVLEKNTLYVNSGLCDEMLNTQELANIKRTDNSLVFRILKLR